MADNLKAAALAANLQGQSKKQVDDLVKSLFVHRELSNLPKEVAAAKYAALPQDQRQDLINKYGQEDPITKPSRGWLGTAWHYTASYNPLTLAFKGAIELSDLATRTYRAVAIPLSEGDVGFAWDKASDKGDKIFNENRIQKAKSKYGQDAVDIAMRIKSGEDIGKLFATATPEQQKYIMLADPQNKVIPNVTDVDAARELFNDTLLEVDQAKFSPGRQFASLILPESLEKNGLVYGLVSGTADAAYRLFADPIVVASKIRSLYVVSKYSLDVIAKGQKVSDYFANPAATNFWNDYGAKLDAYTKAQKTPGTKASTLTTLRDELKVLAPEFGPAVIRLLQDNKVVDAISTRAFLENTDEALKMIQGAVGRKRVILPRLDKQRKTRIAIVTGTDKAVTSAGRMINIDKSAPKIMDAIYGAPITTDGIVEALSKEGTEIGAKVKQSQELRFSSATVAARLDRFKAKFNIAPMFKDDKFDVMAPDASEKVFRLARVIMTNQDARMISETFEAITDIGKRKEMVKGIWGSIAEARGLNLTEAGQKIVKTTIGKDDAKFSVGNFGDDFQDIGAIPSDYTSVMSTPSIVDIDRAAARSGLVNTIMGTANKAWVDNMTGYWSFFTLAGPRYALRNASEDLMVHLAIGGSPWGLAKNRYLATRLNTAFEGARTSTNAADNMLGSFLRILNKKEAAKYETQILAVDGNIVKARDEIKLKKEAIKATSDPAIKASLAAEIEVLRETAGVSAVEQTRRIMATALTSGRVNRLRERMGLKPMFEEEAEILAEHLIYGNLDNTLSLVSEGASNFATGGDFITRSTLFTRSHGVRSEALVVNEPRAEKFARARDDASYKGRALAPQDEAAMLTWLMRIRYFANDELGAIAVANLSNTAEGRGIAIQKIMDWMNKNPSFRKEAQLAARNIDERQHAELVYKRAAEIFEKRGATTGGQKEINLDLLNKIRTQTDDGDFIISGKLSLDDLPTVADDIPEYVLGPALVPISESGNVTASLMSSGWNWLGLANARMSRQPMVFNEIISLRKDMKKSGLEAKYIESFVSKVDQTNPNKVAKATIAAKRQFAELIEERAVNQVLQYVDNPLVRTQLAFGARNFSRFYRATEDFYRRISRVVTYNPMAIRKAALTYDGIAHNGWIQEDDQGEKYFVYPGIEPIYRAVQGAMTAVGVPAEFKVPFPVQFGSQIKMLTPSLNQDSIIPTLSGPLSGVSFKVISNLVDVAGAPGAADTITQMALGKYAVDRSFVSAFLPAHVNRLYESMNTDERDGQYASAWRKAVTYLEAAGHGLKEEYDETGNLIPPSIAAQEQYRQRVKNTTLSILGTRFIFGFVAPASPQVQLKADMANWIRDNGKANFKQSWNSLLDQYPGDFDSAMAKWVELFPNQIPFTVTESEKKTVAVIRYAEESGKFVEENQSLFDKYPQGAAFLIPHKSGFSWDAYQTMRNAGLKYNKNVSDYLRDVQTASDLQVYYSKKNEYEAGLESKITDFERTAARREFTEWARVYKAGRPLLQEELAEGGKKAIARVAAIDDLRNMLNDKTVKTRGPVQQSLKEMLDVYDAYKLQRSALDNLSGTTNLVSFMKDSAIVKLRELSKANENTMSAYNTLFASLLGDTNG
jgi:hypothetical protein